MYNIGYHSITAIGRIVIEIDIMRFVSPVISVSRGIVMVEALVNKARFHCADFNFALAQISNCPSCDCGRYT